MSEREDTMVYRVVVNHEEQFSIWPADKENAPGWRDAGFKGRKAEALAYINEHWTDMRPLSLRQQMEREHQPAAAAPVQESPVAAASTTGTAALDFNATDAAEATPQKKRGLFGMFGRRS